MTIAQAYELAAAHFQAGRAADAGQLLRDILVQQPNHADALHLSGLLAYQTGDLRSAVNYVRRAAAANPNSADIQNNLGLLLASAGSTDDGITALRHAVGLRPDFAQAHNNLGTLYSERVQWDAAIAEFRAALATAPGYAEAEANLGSALKNTGDLDAAIASYRRAAALKPGDPRIASNLLYLLYFHPDYGPREIADAHEAWNQAFAAALSRSVPPYPNDPTPDRKLRVGYVSPDFRQHPVGRFIAPLLAHHDRDHFEIYCYSDVRAPDDLTDRLSSHATWRDTSALSDEQLAERIRADRIDILVDLAMHMEGNRLLAFARKPAPVQVTYLAYAGTTGLTAIDYRLGDPFLDPPGADESVYSEKTVRLRRYWCYQAPPEAPEVGPLPAASNGYITFGCLNNFSKVTPATLDAWARILANVPRSRLILHCGQGAHRARVLGHFARAGADAARIEFVGRLPIHDYFAAFNRIDIALDPFPYPGGTTSCDALWMGVPFLSLTGTTAVSRAGASIEGNLDTSGFVATTPDDYVRRATDLAQSPDRLVELRRTLRTRMRASVLMDAPSFARDVESAYRQMWARWCARPHG